MGLRHTLQLCHTPLRPRHIHTQGASPGVRQHQHRIAAAQRRRQRLDPALQRGDLAPLEHGGIGLGDQARRQVVILSRQRVMDSIIRRARIRVPAGRPTMEHGHQVGPLGLQAGTEEVMEQAVIAVPASLIIQRNEEQVGALQRRQGLLRRPLLILQEGVAKGRGQPLQDSGAEQERAHR